MVAPLTLKNLLSHLDNNAFTEFIYQLWLDENNEEPGNFTELERLPKIGSNVFEQYMSRRTDRYDRINFYNLLVPFYEPIELLKEPVKLDFSSHPFLSPIIKKYNRYYNRRLKNYNIFTDGDLGIPTVAYLSNIAGKTENYYQEYILPGLDALTKKAGLYAQTKFGNCDSFVELSYDKTLKIFTELVNNRKDLVISIDHNKPSVAQYFSEKYLASGIVNGSPVQPIFSNGISQSALLQEFEALLNRKASENQLEAFIKKYYKVIFGPHYSHIETQIWMKFPELDINNRNRRLDVFLKNTIENDWELLELKQVSNPVKMVQDFPNFTSRLYSAIEQLKSYGKLLEQAAVKEKFKQLGIEYFSLELKLVINKKPEISTEKWRWLKQNNENGFKIITMDDILKEVKLRTADQEMFFFPNSIPSE